jgi:hypothetical protein
LVAERICRYATVVGRENVIAGSDCGFATFAGSKEVHPEHRVGEVHVARRGSENRQPAAVARTVSLMGRTIRTRLIKSSPRKRGPIFQRRWSWVPSISAFTRVFDALCAGTTLSEGGFFGICNLF